MKNTMQDFCIYWIAIVSIYLRSQNSFDDDDIPQSILIEFKSFPSLI